MIVCFNFFLQSSYQICNVFIVSDFAFPDDDYLPSGFFKFAFYDCIPFPIA